MKKLTSLIATLALLLTACGGSDTSNTEDLAAKTFISDVSSWLAAGVLVDADWKPLDGRANQGVGSSEEFPAILFGIYDADAESGDFSVASLSQGDTVYFSDLAAIPQSSDGLPSSLALCALGAFGEGRIVSSDGGTALLSYTDVTNGTFVEIPMPFEIYGDRIFDLPLTARSGFAVIDQEIVHYSDYCVALNGRVLAIQTVRNAAEYADPALAQAIADYFASFAAVAAIDEQIDVLGRENSVLDWSEAPPTVRAAWEALKAEQVTIMATHLPLAEEIAKALPFEKDLGRFFAEPGLTLAGIKPLLVETTVE